MGSDDSYICIYYYRSDNRSIVEDQSEPETLGVHLALNCI